MKLSLNASPSFLDTFLAPSDFTRLNFDLSVTKTFFQNDNSMFTHFLADAYLRSRWSFKRNSFLDGTLALNPFSFNQFQIVNELALSRRFDAFSVDKN